MNTKYFTVNSNGCSIRSKIYYTDLAGIRRVILGCHGFGGDKDNTASRKVAEKILPSHKQTALVTFDWPCHGEDARRSLCLADCGKYLATMLDYVRGTYSPDSLCGFAVSFGAYLTLKYINENGNPCEKTVLRSPAVDMYNTLSANILGETEREALSKGRDVLAGFEKKVRISRGFWEELAANDIQERDYSAEKGKLLLLHGTADQIVPPPAVERFAERNSLDYIPFEGADHTFRNPVLMSEAMNYAEAFFCE